MIHYADDIFERVYLEEPLDIPPEFHGIHKDIETRARKILEIYKHRILEFLHTKQASLTIAALDALSVAVLDREEHWKNKIAKDVECYHKLRLQEAMNGLDTIHSMSSNDTDDEESNTSGPLSNEKLRIRDITPSSILRASAIRAPDGEEYLNNGVLGAGDGEYIKRAER